MQKKQVAIIPVSMQQDLAVNKFPADAAYEIRNMRIITNGSNTSFCLTNEKGNSNVNLALNNSTILGYVYVEDYIIAFSKNEKYDYIYKIYVDDNSLKSKVLYKGDLSFKLDNPIEGVFSIESDKVKKVYWVDGLNEVRTVNIVELENSQDYTNCKFEITANNLPLNDTIKVTKEYGKGSFTAGVIQYAYCYYNLHGQETPIINYSCLNYISNQQGITNDKKISCFFNININNVDNSYDYIRIYSIIRTSLDATPEVKRLTDIYIREASEEITFVDNGEVGDVVDPMVLLYLGGDKIIANTLTTKDGTLFLGKINEANHILSESDKTDIQKNLKDNLTFQLPEKGREFEDSLYIDYKGSLNLSQDELLTFKYGETYRIGIQFQFDDGKLSDVVYLKDITNTKHPKYLNKALYLPYLQLTNIKDLPSNIIRARLMYVYPNIGNRTRLCQGIVSPTVYEAKSRADGILHAQPSWFFRDSSYKNGDFIDGEIQSSNKTQDINIDAKDLVPEIVSIDFKYWCDKIYGNATEDLAYVYYVQKKDENEFAFRSYDRACKYLQSYGANPPSKGEWQKIYAGQKSSINVTTYKDPIEDLFTKIYNNNNYYIDSSIVTLYSPEVEEIYNTLNSETSINIEFIGASPIDTYYNDYIITSSNSLRDPKDIGLIKKSIVGPIKSDLLWNDVTPDSNPVNQNPYNSWAFRVYMWHRKGSLNADNTGGNNSIDDSKYGGQYSILNKKVFVNVRDALNTEYFTLKCDEIKSFKIHINNYDGFYKIANEYNYKGVINTVNVSSDKYPIYGVKINKEYGVIGSIKTFKEAEVTNKNEIVYSNDPVPIKYKTANHVVIDLGKGLPKSENPSIDNKLDLTTMASLNEYLIVDKVIESAKDLPRELTEEEFNTLGIYKGYKFYVKDLILDSVYTERVSSFSKTTDNTYYINYVSSIENISTLYQNFTFSIICKQENSIYTAKVKEVKEVEEGSPSEIEYTNKNKTYISTGQIKIPDSAIFKCDIIRNLGTIQYGGALTNKDNDPLILNTKWTPISDFVKIVDNTTTIVAHRGDTYFQKWDCMNTFPYSSEDINQVVDITSTFIESRINLDGRTDIRGNYDASMNYSNFNSINNIYNQTDDFFAKTNVLSKDSVTNYNTGVVFSLSKTYNEEIDSWTNIKLANSILLDGMYGDLSALKVFNNNIYFFQERAVGVINFNNRVQVNTSDGVPIEISNSGKVQGKTYISNFYGCSNKWSIADTASGFYFIDDINKCILHFNGQSFINLSVTKQMYSWINKNISKSPWNLNNKSLRVLYDRNTSDIYFTNNEEALAFNEQLGAFSSFYSYPSVSWLFTLNNHSYQVYNNGVWELQGGDSYSKFFNESKDYSLSIIANPEFQSDKMFDTLEFRTDGAEPFNKGRTENYPFNSLVTTDEYQSAVSTTSSLKKKFRIWRWQIGRNTNSRDRIRNPWAKITMTGNSSTEIRLYDLIVNYYI